MAFFHITLSVRDSGHAIKTIFESPADGMDEIGSFLSRPGAHWLTGFEHRTVRDGESFRAVSCRSALAVAALVRINEIHPPNWAEPRYRAADADNLPFGAGNEPAVEDA
jgi:hypothetical protein